MIQAKLHRNLKRSTLIVLAVSTIFAGCSTTSIESESIGGANRAVRNPDGTTEVAVSGTPGAIVTGFYIKNGQRFEIKDSVPFSFSGTGFSSFEIRKVNEGDSIVVKMQYDNPKITQASITRPLGPDVRSINVVVDNGFVIRTISRK